jgi:ABC-type branched-subunit amino acid transport system ATPase component
MIFNASKSSQLKLSQSRASSAKKHEIVQETRARAFECVFMFRQMSRLAELHHGTTSVQTETTPEAKQCKGKHN